MHTVGGIEHVEGLDRMEAPARLKAACNEGRAPLLHRGGLSDALMESPMESYITEFLQLASELLHTTVDHGRTSMSFLKKIA